MRLMYRPRENTLRLTLDAERGGNTAEVVELPGYVDVGEQGRLVGVELREAAEVDLAAALEPWLVDPVAAEYVAHQGDAAYITLSVPEEGIDEEQVRAAPARFLAELDHSHRLRALGIPRRGAGYEISYPSGNR